MPDSIETVKVNPKLEQVPDGVPLTATEERPMLHPMAPNVQQGPLQPIAQPTTPQNDAYLSLLEKALDKGMKVEELGKIFDLIERQEKKQARAAFFEALTAFKQDPPEIIKTQQVSYTTKENQIVEYRHADLGEICDAVIEGLSRHSLSHRWEYEQQQGVIKVSCVLAHSMGHEERASLMSTPDSSGGKNPIQAIASATTYLERYTLLGVTGLKAKGMDDDGQGAVAPDPELIKEQLGQINGAIADCRAAGAEVNFPAFLKWLGAAGLPADEKGVPDLEKLTPKLFSKAMLFLTEKRKNVEKAKKPETAKADKADVKKKPEPPKGDSYEGPMP